VRLMLDVNDVNQLDPVIRQRERWESRWRLASHVLTTPATRWTSRRRRRRLPPLPSGYSDPPASSMPSRDGAWGFLPRCAVDVPVDPRPDLGRFGHTSSARQYQQAAVPRRSHVNDVDARNDGAFTNHLHIRRRRRRRGADRPTIAMPRARSPLAPGPARSHRRRGATSARRGGCC